VFASFCLSNSNAALIYLRRCTRLDAAPPAASKPCGRFHMQDILWIGLTLGLLAATLGYAALCDNA